jgi:NADH-quinone oxidoreductase subunit N
VLVGLASYTAASHTQAISSVLFYMFSYMFMNMGAFGVVVWLQRNGGTDFLEDFRGLSTWAPGPAAMMAFFLLSLTGIPPTIGFLGKYYVFVAAVNANLTWLAVIGVLNSAVGAFFYLRIIWYMYFEEPRVAREQRPAPALLSALGISAAAVVVLFIFSGPILDAARSSMPVVAGILSELAGKR